MRGIVRSRFLGLLAGTVLVLAAGMAGFALPPAAGGEESSWVLPNPLRLPSAHYNADGHPDYASVANERGGAIRIAADGCGPIAVPLIDVVASVTVIDYDADADPDVVGLGLGGQLFIWQNEGGCRFMPRSNLGPLRSAGRGSSAVCAATGAGSPRSEDSQRHLPTVRRLLRFRVGSPPRLPLSPPRTVDLSQPIATNADRPRPPPLRRVTA